VVNLTESSSLHIERQQTTLTHKQTTRIIEFGGMSPSIQCEEAGFVCKSVPSDFDIVEKVRSD